MYKKNKVVVIGSYNKDITIRTNRLPKRGETVIGELINSGHGGKGANQAVAAARAGADVCFIACVGMDHNGDDAISALDKQGINIQLMKRDINQATGTATIVVDSKGDNSIVVVPGANSNLLSQDIINYEKEIAASDILLLQLELPMETVLTAASLANKHDLKVILNPAPAQNIPPEIYNYVNIITPNRIETELLTGIQINNEESMRNAASVFLERGIEYVLMTLGSEGVFASHNGEYQLISANAVNVVDSTGAGDVFNGVFTATLNNDFSNLSQSAIFASKAATLSVKKVGAQQSIPYSNEIHDFISTLPEKIQI